MGSTQDAHSSDLRSGRRSAEQGGFASADVSYSRLAEQAAREGKQTNDDR